MPTKITVIYDNPLDPEAFEAGYPDQLALAKKIPGVQGVETSKVWPKEDGSPTPAYRMLDMYFTDYDAASRAVTTEEAAAFFPAVFALATGGVRIAFADVEESELGRQMRPQDTDDDRLAELLHETAQHHDRFEKATPAHNWWDWYSRYLSARQRGSTPEEADAAADRYMKDVRGIVPR